MTPYEYLHKKGIKKIHQPWKKYSISIEELVTFLNEYSEWENMSILETYKKATHIKSDQTGINFTIGDTDQYIPYSK